MITIDTTQYTKKIIEQKKASVRQIAIAYYIALRDIGDTNVKEIKDSIKTTGGEGRTYKRKVGGRVVVKQASSQSQQPISWSGRLKAGNKAKVNNPTMLTISNSAKYAYALENKDKSNGGRPFMIRVLKKNETDIRNIIIKRINVFLDKK